MIEQNHRDNMRREPRLGSSEMPEFKVKVEEKLGNDLINSSWKTLESYNH